MLRILVCDDHALLREALAWSMRAAFPEATVDEAADFPSAWERAAQAPGLCLVDLVMPGATPLDGLTRLAAVAPAARLLVVTGQEDDDLLLDVMALGVHGFAPKSANRAVVEAAVSLVLAGGRYLPPRLAELAAQRRPRATPAPAAAHREPPPAAPLGHLSPRQHEVLRLLIAGCSNKEIARKLELSPATVKSHVAHLIGCLGAGNRTEAAFKAQKLGLA